MKRLGINRGALPAALVAIAVLAGFVAASDDPCEGPASPTCAATDATAALIPANAFAYLHVNADPASPQVRDALAVASDLPLLSRAAGEGLGALLAGALAGGDVAEIAPWLGDEAGLALVPGPRGGPTALVALAVADPDGASAFASRIGGGAGRVASHRDVELTSYPSGMTAAQTDGFLLMGSRFAVRSAIDVAAGDDPALSADAGAVEVRAALPEARLGDVYVSGAGIRILLERRGAASEQLDTFVDFSASRGIGVALQARGDGVGLEIVSLLDPERTRIEPGFFSAFPEFSPGAAADLPAGTLAMISFGDPAETLQGLLDQAAAASPDISRAFDRLAAELRLAGVDLQEELLPLLRGETTFAVSSSRLLPRATAVFEDVQADEVLPAVAELQAPLVEALDPARTGQAPTFSEQEIGGVTARSLRITPLIDLTYAAGEGRLVVATDPDGVEAVLEGSRPLAEEPAYIAAAPGPESRISALVFLDIEGLAKLAEPRGLSRIRSYARFRAEIAKLEALGLTVRSQDDMLRTSAFLNVE